MQTIKQSILSIVIGLALVAGISYAEWKGATANPPKENASAPINVSLSNQVIGNSSLMGQNKNLSMGNGQGILGLGGSMNINGSLNVSGVSIFKGGTNKDNYTSFFPNSNGKNYIRGTTILADNDNNTFVGIGTDAPQAKLHIKAGNGNNDPWALRIEQGAATGKVLTSADASGNAYWATPATGGGGGISGYEVKTAIGAWIGYAQVFCSSSKKILGGGCIVPPTEFGHTYVQASYPITSGNNGWACIGLSEGVITVYAICAN